MKKFALIPLVSAIAQAQPYATGGVGISLMNTDKSATIDHPNLAPITLSPSENGVSFTVGAGYRFENGLGFEFAYTRLDTESFDADRYNVNQNQVLASTEVEYSTGLTGNSFAFKPVYFYNLNEKLVLKASAGLTVTDYTFKAGYEEEQVVTEVEGHHFTNESEVAVGGIVGLGVQYNVWNGITLGAEATYQYDSVASAANIQGTLGYQF